MFDASKCKYNKKIFSNNTYLEWWGYKSGTGLSNIHFHKTNGPAYILYNEYGVILEKYYWIFDIHIREEQFNTPGFVDAFILEHS